MNVSIIAARLRIFPFHKFSFFCCLQVWGIPAAEVMWRSCEENLTLVAVSVNSLIRLNIEKVLCSSLVDFFLMTLVKVYEGWREYDSTLFSKYDA